MKLIANRARAVSDAALKDPEKPISSPCNSICRMDAASGWCEGCWRTLDEIVGWSGMDEADKREVWRRTDERAANANAGQGVAASIADPDSSTCGDLR